MKLNTKLTPTDKREMLADLIILNDRTGYTINHLIGQPLSYFDFKLVFDSIISKDKDYVLMCDESFFTHRDRNYIIK